MAWTCPACGRSFGRKNQPHSCRRSVPLDDWLDERPPEVRRTVEAVLSAVSGPTDVRAETTQKSLMIKRERTFAEVTPKKGHIDVAFILDGPLESPRIARTLAMTRTRIAHVVEVTGADGVDGELRGWVRRAYHESPVQGS